MFRHNVIKAAAVILILSLRLSLNAQPAQQNTNQSLKLQLAEASATRIVDRFHQTLDFKGIFADEFVTEPRLRAQALSLDDADKWKPFDIATRERVYVALMTFLHLWNEYQLVQKEHDVPPELEKQNIEPRLLSNSNPPRTVAELNVEISQLERTSGLYRKYLSGGVFRSARYLQSISEGAAFAKEHAHNVPRVENGKSKFGIPDDVPVYVVRRETFDYYFVEEKGKMKLFYVNILPNFPLF
jgi:hypothetical protein